MALPIIPLATKPRDIQSNKRDIHQIKINNFVDTSQPNKQKRHKDNISCYCLAYLETTTPSTPWNYWSTCHNTH